MGATNTITGITESTTRTVLTTAIAQPQRQHSCKKSSVSSNKDTGPSNKSWLLSLVSVYVPQLVTFRRTTCFQSRKGKTLPFQALHFSHPVLPQSYTAGFNNGRACIFLAPLRRYYCRRYYYRPRRPLAKTDGTCAADFYLGSTHPCTRSRAYNMIVLQPVYEQATKTKKSARRG